MAASPLHVPAGLRTMTFFAASLSVLMPVSWPMILSVVPMFAAHSMPVFTAARCLAALMLYPFCRYSSKLFLNPTTL